MLYVDEKKLNEYEKQNHCISYRTLLDCLGIDNLILCNDIAKYHDLELVNGNDFYEENEDDYLEIYQYFLIDLSGFQLNQIIKETDLLIYYCSDLDLYVLGVTHYGTSWDYVLTDAKFTTNWNEYMDSIGI